MPEKKNQHLVPACYLKNFEADVTEIQKLNPKFSGGIYVNNSKLTENWKLKSVGNKFFTKSYFYTLHDDDVKRPVIENFLSRVEGDYAKYIRQIMDGNINNENLSFLSYFVTLQFIRVEKFIDSVQGSWDKIAGWMDYFEGENHYKYALKDIVKRTIPEVDLGGIAYPYARIIINKTNFPFITSDSPVVRRDMNITDSYEIIPKRYLAETVNESNEYPCFFMPLSPNLAYLSFELINHSSELVYSDDDLKNIFYLNYNSIVNSHEYVYSPVQEPMKAERELSKYLSRRAVTFVKIYTDTKRIVSEGKISVNGNDELTLKLSSPNELKTIAIGDLIQLVEVVEDGRSIRGMRNCNVTLVNHEQGLITIESNIKLGKS